MKEYFARQAKMPYTGEWQPQAAQYSGMVQRQPRPGTQQRQPMQFSRLAGGLQPDMPQRDPQMMKGSAGVWPQGYQAQVPRQPPPPQQQQQHFGQQQFGQQQFGQQQNGQQQNGQQQPGVYRRRFGEEQYLQRQRQRDPESAVVIRKNWVFYPPQLPNQQPSNQQSSMQQPSMQQPSMQQPFQQQSTMEGQIPMEQQTTWQPEQQQSRQNPSLGRQIHIDQQGSQPRPPVQRGGFRIRKHLTSSQPLSLQQQQFRHQQPQPQQPQQPEPTHINNNPGTSAWAEAVATMEATTSGHLKISHVRVKSPPQAAPREPPPKQQYHPPAAERQLQPQQPQIPISDAPPTRESGSFSFNSAPSPSTVTGLSGPRAVRRAGTNRPRAEDWNKARPAATPATPAGPLGKRAAGRQSKDSKSLRDPPKLRPVSYTPLPPTPESLFPDIPSTLLSPLGQSKILSEALPTFHKPQATWTPEDWEKYNARRKIVKQKWLDGRRYEWDWAGEGGVDGVQCGGQALDSVRRLVSLNPSYDVKGKRVIMGMLWDRLPHPVIGSPKKLLMLQEGAKVGREKEVRA
ncbi:hypothetical protein BGX38DRAFT_1266488 [Terfezia claveryi]|nr:hypothetical protein BGX38DRAFT_1266488 [Terfezia claveryi]